MQHRRGLVNGLAVQSPDSNGKYTPGERAFAVSKDIQTSLYERFMNDNRFTVEDYDEWCEYVEDIPDDVLRDLAKKVHGGNQYQNGYWYENGYIDTSDKGIEALRETLKYKKVEKQNLFLGEAYKLLVNTIRNAINDKAIEVYDYLQINNYCFETNGEYFTIKKDSNIIAKHPCIYNFLDSVIKLIPEKQKKWRSQA